MQMPEPDLSVISRREEITTALRAIVPGEGVITGRTPCASTKPTASPPIAKCQ